MSVTISTPTRQFHTNYENVQIDIVAPEEDITSYGNGELPVFAHADDLRLSVRTPRGEWREIGNATHVCLNNDSGIASVELPMDSQTLVDVFDSWERSINVECIVTDMIRAHMVAVFGIPAFEPTDDLDRPVNTSVDAPQALSYDGTLSAIDDTLDAWEREAMRWSPEEPQEEDMDELPRQHPDALPT